MYRPEIDGSCLSSKYLAARDAQNSMTTSVDVLEIPQSNQAGIIWLENLDDLSLSNYLEASFPLPIIR